MTLDDIMRMAREATMLYVPVADLEHFAALVAAHEREACARMAREAALEAACAAADAAWVAWAAADAARVAAWAAVMKTGRNSHHE